jgi:hypothetical protein
MQRALTTTASLRPRRSALIALGLAAAVTWSVAGCGSDDDSAATSPDTSGTIATITQPTPVPGSGPPTTRDPAISPSPDQLGDEIATLYLAAYDDVVDALADRPPADEASARLDTLKDDYIEQLVGLGRHRDGMAEPDRANVDSIVRRSLAGLSDDTLAEYQAAIDHYASDAELRELIASFNVIGQYASFDLLREQEPDEAARLGID